MKPFLYFLSRKFVPIFFCNKHVDLLELIGIGIDWKHKQWWFCKSFLPYCGFTIRHKKPLSNQRCGIFGAEKYQVNFKVIKKGVGIVVEAQIIEYTTQRRKFARLLICDSFVSLLRERRNLAVPGRRVSSE